MEYKTILVHLDRGTRSVERLQLAFGLAAKFDAHLLGLFALSRIDVSAFGLPDSGAQINEIQSRYRRVAASAAEAMFRAAAARNPGVKSEWRVTEDDAAEAVRLNARYADLIVIGQHDPDTHADAGIAPEFAGDVALATARPVLLVPYAGRFAEIGNRVLVAWDGGREAARAVADALPLLAGAQTVSVMVFDPERRPGKHGEIPGADFALYLARHGVKVSVSPQYGDSGDTGAQILSRAADMAADLIVMGGYGHSRLRQVVFGGVTRTLLDSMKVPVLMSH